MNFEPSRQRNKLVYETALSTHDEMAIIMCVRGSDNSEMHEDMETALTLSLSPYCAEYILCHIHLWAHACARNKCERGSISETSTRTMRTWREWGGA